MSIPVQAPGLSAGAALAVHSFIDGAPVQAPASRALPIIDPGTGKDIGELGDAGAEGVAAAVAAARTAFDDGRWSETDPEQRQRIMLRLADLIERDAEALARLEALDTGKPLAEATLDIEEAAAVIRYFAGWCDKASGSVIPAPRQYFAAALREPVGVCAAITPWNYPLPILTYKVAPALAFGNTVVAKPSELASASSVAFAQLASEAGLPDGVLNVVLGGGEAGAALAASPNLDKIAFTGSTATGKAVLRAAAETITPATVELGGKSAQLVFADADLEAAAAGVVAGIWTHAGQICIAGSRVLVHESIAEEFLDRLMDHAQALVPGHALQPGSTFGPLISSAQKDKVETAVRQARATGARVLQPDLPLPQQGFFVLPTIITGIPDDHPAVQEEIFGPVLVVQPFTSEEEAIRRANSTPYGLAAGLWTSDARRTLRIPRRLQAGTVWTNTYGIFHPTLPFGGLKASGFGRELGALALEHYTHTKTTITLAG